MEVVRTPTARVVLVDDDPMVGASLSGLLNLAGYDVTTFTAADRAIEHVQRAPVDVILSDVNMPDMTGLEMVGTLRRLNLDLPVIFLTGAPTVEDSMRAIELGAFRYLAKPVNSADLNTVVREALKWSRLTRAATEGPSSAARAALERSFASALATVRLVYQPIVSTATRQTFGYEALMRSSEPSLPSPPAVLDAAERLGQIHTLGRRLRDACAAQITAAQPCDHTFFVNLHSSDLADPTLYDPTSSLAAHAASVVLEITERASLEGIGEVEQRIASLRKLGYRIAVDDLGAGYAGLSYFARISPDVVKIDMSLTRDIDGDPVKRRVVASICSLARDLDMLIVAEGIETEGEFAVVADLGVDLVQGYLIARPAPYPETAS
ncbi:MAG: EAL domain-containing protein [Deltaproteobacteria bacterium]|nr:EAL domain-containing protein [Deltaproteobacteria bacterium]